MAIVMDTSCLYSTVKNQSGRRMIFGFLPPHSVALDNNEEFTVFGDVRQAIISGDRVTSRRNIMAFEAAVERGDLEIKQTPSPILRDTATHNPKMLNLTSGTLSEIDPCWHSSVS